MVSCLEGPAHQQAGPESGVLGAGQLETAPQIETFRVRIADDMQTARSLRAGNLGAVVDQQPTKTVTPGIRLNEERIELDIAIVAWQDRREALNGTREFRHKDPACRQLLERKLDRVRMRENRLPVAGIVQGGTSLKLLEQPLLRWKSRANGGHGDVFPQERWSLIPAAQSGATGASERSAEWPWRSRASP